MPELAIQTRHLRKTYDRKLAVADLNLEVRRGEAFGLLGPNGAGKSTTLKMLLGLVRPTAGGGRMLERPLGDVATRRRVGFLPEHFQFQDWLSGAELLRLHGRLYGMEGARLSRRIGELLERVELQGQADKPIRAYSKGMRQRIGLAQALLHEPDLLFLDEPTSGLDPLGRFLVRDLIREQRERGTTVFLNSHLLGEVEVSCDRVAFVKGGRVLDTRSLQSEEGALRVRVRARNLPERFWSESGLRARQENNGAGPAHWIFETDREDRLPLILAAMVAAGAEVYAFAPQHESLEELFLRIVGSEGGDQ